MSVTLPLSRFDGVVYRAHHPAWAYDPESGEGARIHGGRFNRVGMPCFYAALSLETAWLEAQQGFAFKAQPLTICSYRAELSDILDLTDLDTREAVEVNLTQLGCAWERLAGERKPVPTWELADRLIDGLILARLTKYNLAGGVPDLPEGLPEGRRILVPGQVEDDASVRLGCGAVATNLGLLEATRAANPDAVVIYKPHPDIEAGLRAGAVSVFANQHVLPEREMVSTSTT